MTHSLIISLLTCSIIFLTIVTITLKHDIMPVRYSLVWYFCSFIILLVAIFPNIFKAVGDLLGFETISNLVIAAIITLLLLLTMVLTIIVSGQRKKITLLIQEVSLLKSKENKK